MPRPYKIIFRGIFKNEYHCFLFNLLLLIAAITFVSARVCIASVARITKVWCDKHHVLMAAKSALASTWFRNFYLTIFDVDRLSTFWTISNDTGNELENLQRNRDLSQHVDHVAWRGVPEPFVYCLK